MTKIGEQAHRFPRLAPLLADHPYLRQACVLAVARSHYFLYQHEESGLEHYLIVRASAEGCEIKVSLKDNRRRDLSELLEFL